MKHATLSLLVTTAAPAGTFLLGLTRLSTEASFALASSIALVAFAIDTLFISPACSRY